MTTSAARPEGIVRRYLEAMERRDLAAAQALLAPGFSMVFPGNRRFDTLEQLVASAKGRYRSAKKTYERFDALGHVVYCFGTLYGELLDGTPYSGIRFIDQFPCSSQRWGEVLAEIEADHWAQIGWSRSFDAAEFYARLLRELRGRELRGRGF